MARRVTSATLVGRTEELAVISEAVASAKRGQPRIVLVSGDAGIGKTRLITEACHRADAEGVLTALGSCVQLGESSVAYAPLIQALRDVRGRLSDDEFDELLGPARATVGPLLGITEGGGIERSWLFEQLLGIIHRLGELQPTLIVFEDMHWADASTRDLVAFLGRNLRNASIAIVLSYRSDELHRRHPLRGVLANLERDPMVERVALTGLGRQGLVAILAQISERPPSVDGLLERTDGNPFYVEELVAAADMGRNIPATLAEVILARVNGLPEPTPEVLHQAAVLGDPIDDEWLAELTGQPLGVITVALREAVSHHILTVDGSGCRFRHALMREALYDDLLPGERERLHTAAARYLEGRRLRISEHVRQTLLAYHAYAGGDLPTAFAASVRAGVESERVHAYADAAMQYERALSLWDRVHDPVEAAGMTRPELLLRAAETLHFSSLSSRSLALAEAALAAFPEDTSPEQRAVVLIRVGRINWTLQRGPAAVAAYEQAVALLKDRPASPEQALALAALGQSLMLRERYSKAVPVLRQAIEVARAVDASDVVGHALASLGPSLVGLGHVDAGLAAGREGLRLSRDFGTNEEVCRSYTNLVHSLDHAGRYDEAVVLASEGVKFAAASGHMSILGYAVKANQIVALYCAGRWREAERIEAEFRERLPERTVYLELRWLNLLLGQGRVAEARPLVEHLLEATADAADVQFRALAPMRAGELADLESRWDDAREYFRQGLELARDSDDQYYLARGYAGAVRVERRRAEFAAARRGTEVEVVDARRVADQLIEQARELAAKCSANDGALLPESAAWLQTAEAEYAAARGRDTAQTWADLATTWDRVGQPYPRAMAQYRQAEVLVRDHGGHEEARRCATSALEVADDLGAVPLADDIRRLAQRARLELTSPTEATPDAVAGLNVTPREAEVLALLAAGRTNRQISRELFISEKTASVHVSNLLRKLGVSNRIEAAAIAQRMNTSG